jgi:hypothetical protein
LANPHRDFVIASQGEMASFPAGTTPFSLESARGVLCKKSHARSMTQLTSSTPTLCRSAILWESAKIWPKSRGDPPCTFICEVPELRMTVESFKNLVLFMNIRGVSTDFGILAP